MDESTIQASGNAIPLANLNENELRAKIEDIFKKRPCDFQYKLFEAQRSGKNIISIARTGSGKTLTYFMPLVLSDSGIIVIVTALNVLGEQFEREARAAGYTALSVNGENDSDTVFKDIKSLKYRVLIFSPDIMMKRGGRCQTILWPTKSFVSKIQRIIFDEAHCVLQWGLSFRPEYKAAANITFYLPTIPVYLSSATMAPAIVSQLKQVFRLTEKNTEVFQRSNDRPNIAIVVRRMQYPQDSFEDLAFLVPKDWKEGDPPPPKFMVFFDNKKDAEAAAKFLWSRVSMDLRQKISWFHAGMTRFFRVEQIAKLRGDDGISEEAWGFMATDSGGLGLDVPNVNIVVQYKATSSLDTIVQRFGRAVRDVHLQGVAILIAEPHWFYEDLLQRENARQRRGLKRSAPLQDSSRVQQFPQVKRTRIDVNRDSISSHSITSNILSPSKRANRPSGESVHTAARVAPSVTHQVRHQLELEPGLEIEQNGRGCNEFMESCEISDESDEEAEDGGSRENSDKALHTQETLRLQSIPVQESVDDEEVLAMIHEGIAFRTKGRKSAASNRPPRVPDRETCLFINAHNLAAEQHCRRWHVNKYYANHLAPRDSKLCCERCEVKPPTICCDICHPAQVVSLIPLRNDNPPSRTRKPRRFNIKNFTMSTSDKALQKALFQWRDAMAKEKFEEYEEYGGDILMHYRIVDRVVELSQANKLESVKSLQDQTGWAWAPEYGEQVLELVQKHSAMSAQQVAASSSSTHQRPQHKDTAQPRQSRASPTCSICGETGHRRNSGRCPVNIAARRNENQPLPLK
ncbi:P-loop containing nucleoside triphosphate hydrolase protein [Irpex rosettiformis]|uniref:P-loop containing nucleoside triphosphate hydrolase protein n=1 Tax=Irpex rosettiformis TaxID=378272 RepID=A0ACB8U8R4_9APHY|nr:P-loop containing nucleoside triphosphate hydrolase protein [Irpex rosettiformis]